MQAKYGKICDDVLYSEQQVGNCEGIAMVEKEVSNGILDFYVNYGFAYSVYHDWIWKIFYKKGSKTNKCSIWVSNDYVYEKQRYMEFCS